jgi:hypothetical protein
MFQTADPKDVKSGKYTDVYFTRTMEVLKAKKIDKWVKAEFIAKRFPEDYGWGVLAGGADRCSCGGRFKELLIPYVQHGKIHLNLPKPQAIRRYVLE